MKSPVGVPYEDILMLGCILFNTLDLMSMDASRLLLAPMNNSPVPG